ncbi:hypothetical protein AB0J47_41815 [Nocardia sp. NPDC049737]|uniref:hypothetical protein n=1 Tax=Nocardia sp. NPDC049737 TaxID=3154358 RepID=UPI003429F8AA
MSLIPFRSSTRRVREVSVYIHIDPDGRRSVNIHGGTSEEVKALMAAALLHPHITAAPILTEK